MFERWHVESLHTMDKWICFRVKIESTQTLPQIARLVQIILIWG